MNDLERKLKDLKELINNKDYINAILLIKELEKIGNEDLNKHFKILMDLFSVITCLPMDQIDIVKNLKFEEIEILKQSCFFSDITKENAKHELIFHRRYAALIKDFKNWESNTYQDILRMLINLAYLVEKKCKSTILNNIYTQNYEKARKLLENKAETQRLKKLEKVTLILLGQIIVFMKTKELPEVNLVNTNDYVEALANNNFKLALKLVENYNLTNNINFNQTPNYLLLRDICKVLENIKNYKNYCMENKIKIADESYEFIKNKYNEIKKYGLITVKCKTKEKVAKILKALINYPDISSIIIGEGKTLVLKYSPYIDSKNKVPGMMKKANLLFSEKEIEDALKIYLDVLKNDDIKATTYSKVGLCFVELRNYTKAIEYLTIAMEIGKKEKKIYDYHALITKLQGKLSAEDIKPHYNIKNLDFTNKQVNFGLGDLTEITKKIIESGLDVESACISLGISSENTELIKLVYAREFFSRGEDEIAKKFLKSVEQSDNKTSKVIKALKETRSNKKIYLNKKETTMSLSLKLKPKKNK